MCEKPGSMALVPLPSFTFTLGKVPRLLRQKEEPQHATLTATRLLSNAFIVAEAACISGAFRKPPRT